MWFTWLSAVAGEDSPLPRVKPFKYTYEKEIVMYAYFKKLDYFSTECVYAPFAARGAARDFVKQLEVGTPSCHTPTQSLSLPQAIAILWLHQLPSYCHFDHCKQPQQYHQSEGKMM